MIDSSWKTEKKLRIWLLMKKIEKIYYVLKWMEQSGDNWVDLEWIQHKSTKMEKIETSDCKNWKKLEKSFIEAKFRISRYVNVTDDGKN